MGLFQDKVVVVTGAGGGLGESYAIGFAKEGAKIVVNDLGGARDGSGSANTPADNVVDNIKQQGGIAVANYDSVATREGAEAIIGTALKEYGRIDILVNNAGILRDKTMLKMTDDMWDLVLDVHLKGTYLCSQVAAKAMAEQKSGGRIINTTSFAGLKGNFGQINYGAAKAGIYGLTLVAAMELAKHRITVNAVAPLAKTRMTEDISIVSDNFTADMISPMVMFLASDNAAGITGRIFGIHGPQLFEYKMHTTDGAKRDTPWTVADIEAALPQIEGSKQTAPMPTQVASGAPAAVTPAAPKDRVAEVFQQMPGGFLSDKAGSWNTVMHWQIAGSGNYSVKVENGQCSTAASAEGSPTCTVKTDTDTFLGLIDGTVDGQQAYMQGKISADNIADLMKYQTSFSKEKAEASSPPSASTAAPSAAATPQDRVAEVFQQMPSAFLSDKAGSWNTVMHWQIAGSGNYSVKVENGQCSTAASAEGSPTCTVKTDTDTFLGLIDGTVDGQQAYMQGKISADNIADLMKYQTSFSKEKADANTGASGAATSASAAPGTAAPAEIDPNEEIVSLLESMKDILPPLGENESPLQLDFDIGVGGKWRIRWDTTGANSEAVTEVNAEAQVKTDPKTLSDLLAGRIEAKAAFQSMQVLTSQFLPYQRLMTALRENNYISKVKAALQARPVSITSDLRKKTLHGGPIVVLPAHTEQYAQATNDKNTRYKKGVTPPLLPVRYHFDLAKSFFTDPGIKANILQLVHGEQEIVFHQPIRTRDIIAPKASLAQLEHKSKGSIISLRYRLMREGELINETFSNYFVRRSGAKSASSDSASLYVGIDKPDFAVSMKVKKNQSEQYAEASLDDNPIHVNTDIAKAAGFKGVILHGLCTLAFASQAIVKEALDGNPEKLMSIKARFTKPVLMGDNLTTRGKYTKSGSITDVNFDVVNQDGVAVITHGVAKLRSDT